MRHPADPNRASDAAPEPELTPEQLYPCVRPEVARLLVELDEQVIAHQARADLAMAEFNRPRGIMGKLFGLRTSVG